MKTLKALLFLWGSQSPMDRSRVVVFAGRIRVGLCSLPDYRPAAGSAALWSTFFGALSCSLGSVPT